MPCRRPCCISARLETAPRPPRPPRFVALGGEEKKEGCESAGSRNEFPLRHAAERLGQAWAALACPHRKRRQRPSEGGIRPVSSRRPHLQRPGSGGSRRSACLRRIAKRRQPPASRPPRGGISIRSHWAPQSPRGNRGRGRRASISGAHSGGSGDARVVPLRKISHHVSLPGDGPLGE